MNERRRSGSPCWRAPVSSLLTAYKTAITAAAPVEQIRSDKHVHDNTNKALFASYLSLGDEVSHDGGVAELGGQVDAAAALAVDQRRVCAVFHELHHHG